MNLIRVKTISKLFTMLLFTGFVVLTSCGDDDSAEPTLCDGLTTIDGDATLNGSDASLTIAQLLVSSFDDDTNYQFQIGAAGSDCTELKTVSFTLMIPTGTAVDGTYNFNTFFEADDDEAFGSVTNQNLESLSQSQSEIASGTVSITSNGESNFTLDINATPLQGSAVRMELTHQF